MSGMVILLIGLHGSGKSTFTKAVTGADVEISRYGGVTETTRVCSRHTTFYKGKRFTIIDTPGLADKNTSEENIEILEQIAGQLGQNPVHGVIYLHSIQNVRFTAVDKANIRILKAICGESFFPHVAFVTTRWDRVDRKYNDQYETVNHDLEMARRSLLQKSPRVFKFLNDGKSHERVLDYFVDRIRVEPAPPQLLFAEELRKYCFDRKPRKAVRKTEAGKQMAAESKKVSEKPSCCTIL